MPSLLLVLAALAASGAAGPSPSPDACTLLADDEVRRVQGAAPAQKVPSVLPGPAFRLVQCFFRAPVQAESVSVAVAHPADGRPGAVREFWRHRFHGEKVAAMIAGRKKEKPPQAVAGLGDEAFWVGDARTGSLYVLKGNVFLRVSVGGAVEQDVKVQRARTLAERALGRIG